MNKELLRSYPESNNRLLTSNEANNIIDRIIKYSSGLGQTVPIITSLWSGVLRWGRNDINSVGDKRIVRVDINRYYKSETGRACTDQFDDVSLSAAVKAAERVMGKDLTPDDIITHPPDFPKYRAPVWSDDTYNAAVSIRGKVAEYICEKAGEKGLFSAGYIEVHAGNRADSNENGILSFESATQAQCSITVRHPQGKGSGWAGLSSFDWKRIDPFRIADRAFDKCTASLDPVKIEPGRYTVVMEPQAVADCVELLFANFSRVIPEAWGVGPFFLGQDRALQLLKSKLGLQVIDNRITISHVPIDPDMGQLGGSRQSKHVWIENGALVNLSYQRTAMLSDLTTKDLADYSFGFHMSGGESNIDEMISSTERGLLVSRLHGVTQLERNTLISSGMTRDGLWLIENGKISKSVNNLRITESPLFMLNQVEQLGVPTGTFSPVHSSYLYLTPRMVPPIKARDFAFTALVDAV